MKFKFLHMADVHLGYRQYGLAARAQDFAAAFAHAVEQAITNRVDFVLLAGDLFHKRSIDAETLNHASETLERLRDAAIPCVAVEGNHELALYGEAIGWMAYLARRGLLTLLRTDFDAGVPQLRPQGAGGGSWVDVHPGVRVHGLHYVGAATTVSIGRYAEALAAADTPAGTYSIFMAHTGVSGVVEREVTSPPLGAWSALRPHVDYVALGHIHKPFVFDNWLCNPGSLESCASDEHGWRERGVILAEVDTVHPRGSNTAVTQIPTPRRAFMRQVLKVDALESQRALCDLCRRQFEMQRHHISAAPMVEIILTGKLGFDAATLRTRDLEEIAQELLAPLSVQVRNMTTAKGVLAAAADGISRSELEQHVLSELFAQDLRFRPRSREWAQAASALKDLALNEAPAEQIIDELGAWMARLEGGSPAHANPLD